MPKVWGMRTSISKHAHDHAVEFSVARYSRKTTSFITTKIEGVQGHLIDRK